GSPPGGPSCTAPRAGHRASLLPGDAPDPRRSRVSPRLGRLAARPLGGDERGPSRPHRGRAEAEPEWWRLDEFWNVRGRERPVAPPGRPGWPASRRDPATDTGQGGGLPGGDARPRRAGRAGTPPVHRGAGLAGGLPPRLGRPEGAGRPQLRRCPEVSL